MKKEILILIALAMLVGSAAQAGHHFEISYIEPGQVGLTEAMLDLTPWFDDFEGKMRSSASYRSFLDELKTSLRPQENIMCSFKVEKNGSLTEVKITSSCGNIELDNRLVSLVKSIQFSALPNNLPTQRGIQLEFWRKKTVEAPLQEWSQLSPEASAQPCAIVDYIGPSEKHPWQKFDKERFRGGGVHEQNAM